MANFDRIAPLYRWLEYASFGPALQRCRLARLPEMAASRRALVYGDGDGRFLQALMRLNPGLEADAVDSSPAMLARLQRRAPGAICHVADALTFTPPQSDYDLVVTHFFLDCFSEDELDRLCEKLVPHLAPRAQWIVSEFAIPPRGAEARVGLGRRGPRAGARLSGTSGRRPGWGPRPSLMRPLARLVVGSLYRAFGLLTGLAPRRLPDYASQLRRHGFVIEADAPMLGGLLRTQRWRLTRQ